jgi:predicted dehydrogenase
MIGGGEGAFIGAVHRAAAALEGLELACGAFSSDPTRSRRSGEAFGLPADRCYGDYAALLAAEAARPAGDRIDFVTIVTPNHLHLPIATAALRHGFHVLSEKPATRTLAECLVLRNAIAAGDRLYGLTHPYAFYPLVAEAAARVRGGELGSIRKVIVEYTQGWLAEPVERSGQKQAEWRVDPEKAGASGCFGDIGVHAFQLAEHVTGLTTTAICAELSRVVPQRRLDDDGTALLRFDNGANGVLIASQICAGEENALTLRIYGDKGGLEWRQQEPNSLWLKPLHAPVRCLRAGGPDLGSAARALTRLPAGHPEGYIEAFANVYRAFAGQIRALETGRAAALAVPGIGAAVRGMAFIEAAVAASASPQKWHAFPEISA